MRADCSLCHDLGCLACGKAVQNPTVRAWESAQESLEVALPGQRPALAYGDTYARVTVGGRRIAMVEAVDAVTAIRDVTALVLRYADDEISERKGVASYV